MHGLFLLHKRFYTEEKMTCSEAHAYVKPFLKHSLSTADTNHYIRHIEQCSECRDELEIAFMIDKMSGLSKGVDLPTYDFTKMFREMIRSEKKRCRMKRIFFFALLLCLAALIAVLMHWL